MPTDDASPSGGEWLRFSHTDLRAATLLVDDEGMATVVCFHAQQAAEKALKGYLAWLGAADIPKTHDLGRLADLIVREGGQTPPEAALEELADYGVSARYPGSRPLAVSEARDACGAARRVVGFVSAAIGLQPDA